MLKYKVLFEEWLNMSLTSSKNKIHISDRWSDKELFYQDMGEKPEGSVLTLLDNKKGFIPGNCIWAFPLGSELIQEKKEIKKLNKIRIDSITGVTGVTWNDQKLRWWARIRVDGKQKHLLFSKSQEEAIKARLNGEIDHFGHIQQTEYAYLLD
jgi:hypothetical protein